MRHLPIILSLTLLTACSTVQVREEGAKRIDDAQKRQTVNVEAFDNRTARLNEVRDQQGAFVSSRPIASRPDIFLPSAFTKRLTLRRDAPVTLEQLVRILSAELELPVAMLPDTSPAAAAGAVAARASQASAVTMPLDFEGTAQQLLDRARVAFNMTYELRDDVVVIVPAVTRVFTINSNAVRAGATGGAAPGDPLESMGRQIRAAFNSAIIEPNRTNNTITVTVPATVMPQVVRLVEDNNKLARRQVVYKYELVRVTSSTGGESALNLDGVISNLDKFGLALASPTSLASAAAGSITLSRLGGRADGSKAVLKMLNQFGQSEIVRSGIAVNQSGTVARDEEVSEQVYLARVTPAPSGGSGTGSGTPGLEPGTVRTGFTAEFSTNGWDGDTVSFSFEITNRQLVRISTVSSGGLSIQTPEVTQTSINGVASARVGDIIVLRSRSSISSNYNRQGLLPGVDAGPGASASGNRERSTLILLITPLLQG
jgi:hypothetical protein